MRIFITGANGQLGFDLVKELKTRGHEVITNDIVGQVDLIFDIVDERIENKIIELNPDVIIHTAAWTNVDEAEKEENKDKVWKLNVLATKNILNAAKELKCKFLFISTDYVFNGLGEYPNCALDKHDPINYYGLTKSQAEILVNEYPKSFIVKTQWLFGINGNNFIKTMIKLSKTNTEIKVVDDQWGTPTYTKDLSKLLADMINSEMYGSYNATNESTYITFAEFAKEIFNQIGSLTKVIPVSTEQYGKNIAKRPLNGRLEKIRLAVSGFNRLPEWKDAVSRYLDELKENNML